MKRRLSHRASLSHRHLGNQPAERESEARVWIQWGLNVQVSSGERRRRREEGLGKGPAPVSKTSGVTLNPHKPRRLSVLLPSSFEKNRSESALLPLGCVGRGRAAGHLMLSGAQRAEQGFPSDILIYRAPCSQKGWEGSQGGPRACPLPHPKSSR